MKNFRATLAFLLICLFVFGCKFGSNSNNNNSDNSNNSNSNENSNGNSNKTSNKNSNKSDDGDIGKPDVSKIPIPSKKPDQPMQDEGSGEVVKHTDAKAQFTIPSGWNGKAAEDRYIVASPDDRLEVFFYVPADGSFDKGIDTVVAEMKKYLTNMKANGDAKKVSLNGMKVTELQGTGGYEGTTVVWAIDAVQSPGYPLFVVTVADPNDFNKNKDGYSALINSIKPTN